MRGDKTSKNKSDKDTLPDKNPDFEFVEEKLNICKCLNKDKEYLPKGTIKDRSIENDQARINKFTSFYEKDQWDIHELRTLSWGGIPRKFRARTWKVQFEYIPCFPHIEKSTLESKRKEYRQFREKLYDGENFDTLINEDYIKMSDQITKDIKRTLADTDLFKNDKIQMLCIRLLVIWHVRHINTYTYMCGLSILQY